MKLSVVMIVKNEAENLRLSLPPLQGLADEIIILDSGSTDDSETVARTYGAQWFVNQDWQGFGKQRQRAQALASGDWILALDADEVVSPELATAIRQVVEQPLGNVVYGIRLLDYLFGWQIDNPHWRIKPHWRLYPAHVHFDDNQVHESLVLNGAETATLDGFALHHTARTPLFWLNKRLAYALTWAQERHARGHKVSIFGIMRHSCWAWIKQYILDGRFLQGISGLIYATLFAQYTFNKYALLYDINRHPQHYQPDYQPHAVHWPTLPPLRAKTQQSGRKATLSVVMIVKNEQKHLPACLDSIYQLADEIVILDSGSCDATREIADYYGAQWYEHLAWPGFGRQRQIAQSYAHGDYILALDADEQPDTQLLEAIAEVLQHPVQTERVFAIRRQNIFCGQKMRRYIWSSDKMVRLYARSRFQYHPYDVHESVNIQDALVVTLTGSLRHYTNDNLYHFMSKNLRYSHDWATGKLTAGKKQICLLGIVMRGGFAFIRKYFIRGTVFGGGYGFLLAGVTACYTFNKYLMFWLLKQDKDT